MNEKKNKLIKEKKEEKEIKIKREWSRPSLPILNSFQDDLSNKKIIY